MQCEKCSSENIQYVKYKIEGGSVQIRQQCQNCGYVNTTNIKHSIFTNEEYENMPFLDEDLRESYYAKEKENREKKYQEQRQEGFDKLKEYYKSNEWQEKRLQRLRLNEKLFDGWCERCGKVRATQVHHRSYVQINGNEHPFDLEALCEDCHKMLHPHMDNQP